MPITSPTSSPPDSGFTPRKEFIRDQQSPPNSFAILALSGSNFIRLYSFPQSVVSGLQHLFERLNISIATREDQPQGLYELSIDHKPWANPKSVFSEKLLVDILAVIYRSGFNFLSCIDYGREPDDKLAMAFSKPASSPTPPVIGSRNGTPVIPSAFPAALGVSTPSLPEKPVPKRVPFALSFTSTTVMRVMSPPLHLTPAILQAVRGSWPRGVVSEKKVGENCFEFKLKGYKWFQQDNFAFDSLQHILSLLRSLDAQSFTLLTSLSLTNRSRIKDLWIFTGPAPEGDDLQRQASSLQGTGPKSSLELPYQHAGSPSLHHRRLASDASMPSQPMASHHRRSVTEDLGRRHQENNSNSSIPLSPPPHHPSLLRKPAPRAQVPVSVIQESEAGEEVQGYATYNGNRADLPSMVSTSVPNMTGVGAQGGQEAAYPFGSLAGMPPSPGGPIQSPYAAPPVLAAASRAQSSSGRSFRSASEKDYTPPLPSTSPPSSPRHRRTSTSSSRMGENSGFGAELERKQSSPTPPQTLLSPGTFRDSGLSDVSHDISIRWTGVGKEGPPGLARLTNPMATPKVPGGWQATPIDEGPERNAGFFPQPDSPQSKTPIYETFSRVESPEVVRPDIALRKSEAVVFGMIAASSPSPPPVPSLPPSAPLSPPAPAERAPSKASSKLTKEGPPEGGQGWVLVNVEGSAAASPLPEASAGSSNNMRLNASREGPATPMPHYTRHASTPDVNRSPPTRNDPSPAAKAIAVIDAVESRQKKSKAASVNKEMAEGGSGVRRFFSLNRKNSQKRSGEGEEDEQEKNARERALSQSTPTTYLRTTFRDRLRNLGTPEAVRREDKPRNID